MHVKEFYENVNRLSGNRFSILETAIRTFTEKQAAQASAGLAYYTFFSIFPLMLAFIAGGSYFLDSHQVFDTVTQFIQPMTIDIGIILDVTPQIAEDGTIIMNIHPSITDKTGEKVTPDGKTTFPLLSVRETDTTVRVRDGQTIIIAGLMQERIEEAITGVPGLQSLPVLGGLFRYKTATKKNTELVIMITPTLQVGKRIEDFTGK